jgi:hypothetical protein
MVSIQSRHHRLTQRLPIGEENNATSSVPAG